MKTIDMVVTNEFSGVKRTIEFAVNNNGTGLFTRRRDGTFCQHAGTCDFYAANPLQLAKLVRKWSDEWASARMVRGSARGWNREVSRAP